MRKTTICLCENKDADQADQHLCFRYKDITIPLLKYEISSFYLFSESVQAGLCQTGWETLKTIFSRKVGHIVNSYFMVVW